MKQNEIFADLRTTAPFMVRADGKGFSKFTKRLKFTKPYDLSFNRAMTNAVRSFVEDSGYNARFAYTFSDEISIYFDELPFEGRVEKLTSTIASYLSSAFTAELYSLANGLGCYEEYEDSPIVYHEVSPVRVAFDARVVPLQGPETLRRYMGWRQAECWRNFIQGWGFWTFVQEDGLSQTAAQKRMDSLKISDVNEMMFQRGVNLNDKPCWQRRGTVFSYETYEKDGFNPKTGETVRCTRRRLKLDNETVPEFRKPDGESYLRKITEAA